MILPSLITTKILFPFQPHLWQIAYSTAKTIYNPWQFWRSYRVAHLERCWNWKQEQVEKLEHCWQKEYQPRASALQGHCQLSKIELKWRGVSYCRLANLASVTQPVTSSVNHSRKVLDADQDSSHLSQTSHP